jgi:hypothetical protein
MKQLILFEHVEEDGSSWQPASPEEQTRAAQVYYEKLATVRRLSLTSLPLAYQGLQDPQGHLGSHSFGNTA